MKTSIYTISALLTCLGSNFVSGFSPSYNVPSQNIMTQRNMFGGAGAAAPLEDDEGTAQKMEQMAKSMGMSVEEYQLGINARMKMEEEIANLRVSGGDASKGVTVERDGNSPPQHLIVTITDEGKALGKSGLEAELVKALKTASEESKKGRDQAQAKMMQFIGEQMKNMG
mmetsp:Transcript_6240/g.9059  ORF Transcript_6240/g.9059 Transcript_6240/m.9059 type:complete len:170 (+) Transcript_6240:134-643(+)|eukprot:CAMPEP_0184864492 /NCGR_PEP_ID=MMETSP0580-20130426/15177_1 /TAXON_ID=1118495 /ORGANISM="Dactyliosolen fragilissimus" /LENGTH=169 /DNA_ID=CAMNT_0027363311 /DNA_START=95 /DNA_END=604 /DNA_ORIENTATION=+